MADEEIRLGAPCPVCSAPYDHQHARLVGGPFDTKVRTLPPGEAPPWLTFHAGLITVGDSAEYVYPPPLPGPEPIRYRPVILSYTRLDSEWTHRPSDAAFDVTEVWPHRDDEGMLVYQHATTAIVG